MQYSDPQDVRCPRRSLGQRTPRSRQADPAAQDPETLTAFDRAIEEADRDVAAWVAEFREPMTRVAVRAGADFDTAKDIAQKVIVKALVRRRGGFTPDDPGGYLNQATRNETNTTYRQDRLRPFEPSFFADRPDGPDDQAVARVEAVARVQAAIESLPSPYAEVVTLKFIQGTAVKDIAAELGVPVRTTYRRLQKAMDMLADRLKESSAESLDSSPW